MHVKLIVVVLAILVVTPLLANLLQRVIATPNKWNWMIDWLDPEARQLKRNHRIRLALRSVGLHEQESGGCFGWEVADGVVAVQIDDAGRVQIRLLLQRELDDASETATRFFDNPWLPATWVARIIRAKVDRYSGMAVQQIDNEYERAKEGRRHEITHGPSRERYSV